MSVPFVVPNGAQSWVAGSESSEFPIQNLPLGVVKFPNGAVGLAVRIGDQAIDVQRLVAVDLIPARASLMGESCGEVSVGEFRELRESIFDLLEKSNPVLRDRTDREEILIPLQDVEVLKPAKIPNFTDFYSGIHHASNVGRMFRPDMPPLLPNYRFLPVAYNGRASTIYPDGAPVRRPKGQVKDADRAEPVYMPTRELDFEAEMGFFVARHEGESSEIEVSQAEEHILGLCLVNDWSARDVQRWEYQPLGPFLAKSFMTSISPWIVSLDALEPFRCAGQEQAPKPPPHLVSEVGRHFDITIEVSLQSAKMRAAQVISRTNSKYLYWTFAQQLTHLTSNGLACQPGELCGSGTISGESSDSFGSLLEIGWRGTRPLKLQETGEARTFLEDGDTLTVTAFAIHPNYRIGFGQVSGRIDAAH